MKHGLNTDQDSEQGQEEKREETERGCVAFSNLWLGPCFYVAKNCGKELLSGFPVRRFFFFQFPVSCPDPCSIRVSSLAKNCPPK